MTKTDFLTEIAAALEAYIETLTEAKTLTRARLVEAAGEAALVISSRVSNALTSQRLQLMPNTQLLLSEIPIGESRMHGGLLITRESRDWFLIPTLPAVLPAHTAAALLMTVLVGSQNAIEASRDYCALVDAVAQSRGGTHELQTSV